MTISADYQMEFGGLLMGATTDYSISEISGLADYPDVQVADHSRLRRHGLLPGDDFLGGRSVIVTLTVKGTSGGTVSTLMSALKTALPIGSAEADLSFQFPGVAGGTTATLSARPRKLSAPINTQWSVGSKPSVIVEFFATDPRIYADETSSTTSLPIASGGLTFSAIPSFTFGTVGGGGSLTLDNTGSFSTPPTFQINGPVTGPAIAHEESGRLLYFDIVIATGDYLLVDADARTVLLNGTQNRYNTLDTSVSTWFDLEPGDNTVNFSADLNEAGTLTVSWRSAWI